MVSVEDVEEQADDDPEGEREVEEREQMRQEPHSWHVHGDQGEQRDELEWWANDFRWVTDDWIEER